MDLVELGIPCPTQGPSALTSDRARALHRAVVANPDFQLVELRSWTSNVVTCDVLIVDCTNDQVPSKSRYGIKNRERLALVVPPAETSAPQARALRADFPLLPHINQTVPGEPLHLCLHLESWTETRRSWTPERFLKRILWWLEKSSVGALHAPDQPLERLYFPFERQVVFPRDFEESLARKPCRLVVESCEKEAGLTIMCADFGRISAQHSLSIATLVVHVDKLVHGRVEEHPTTLGVLSEQLAAHGMSLVDELRLGLAMMWACNPKLLRAEFAMIVLDVELCRDATSSPEKRETRAFFIGSLEGLGEELGVIPTGGAVAHHTLLTAPSHSITWKAQGILPVDVRSIPSRTTTRRLSGVCDPSSEDRRTLIGVGALGSNLLELWTREGWGRWTIVDPDRIEAHNLVRHLGYAHQIGMPKVRAVRGLMSLLYDDDAAGMDIVWGTAVPATENPKLETAYSASSLIVDVSTTLTVPRELSRRDAIARCASTFISPSGIDAVLMIEDHQRELRLRDIEPQYYASLLGNDWGRVHLGAQPDQMRVGTGCRDASFVLSLEQIQLFGATLARQIRTLTQESQNAHLRLWRADADGSIVCRVVELTGPIHAQSVDWNIVACCGIDQKMRRLRDAKLPVETGGAIAGYIDHQSRTIFVVDVLPAPPDSKESTNGFIRGKEGLAEAFADISTRTMKIVRYIGDWHSHPRNVAPTPSPDDRYLSQYLAAELATDGDPALMIIVGDRSSTYVLADDT